MTRDRLATAADHVRAAADAASDEAHADRLSGLADQLSSLATADRDPDHGRLARLLSAFDEVEAAAGDAVGDHLDAAREEISAFRETLEGV